MLPTISRIVQYRLPPRYRHGPHRWRPALVVNAFGSEAANLTVFLDGCNDAVDPADIKALGEAGFDVGKARRTGMISVSSASHGDSVGCWRWTPRAEEGGLTKERVRWLAEIVDAQPDDAEEPSGAKLVFESTPRSPKTQEANDVMKRAYDKAVAEGDEENARFFGGPDTPPPTDLTDESDAGMLAEDEEARLMDEDSIRPDLHDFV